MNLSQFQFRGLHPEIFLGTCTDRYSGWIGQVYSPGRHAGKLSRGKQAVIRLITPLGIRYEEAYTKAFPFDKMVEGMMPARMVEETVEILRAGIRQGLQMNLLINNRAGGNAPPDRQKDCRGVFKVKSLKGKIGGPVHKTPTRTLRNLAGAVPWPT